MDIPVPTKKGCILVPAPLSSAADYGGGGGGGGGRQGHILHHHHQHYPTSHINANSSPGTAINGTSEDQQHRVVVGYNSNNSSSSSKMVVRYWECLKNHAAMMGGIATDGCGEFMPGGEEGTTGALTCSACGCHRNFHRKEVEGGGGGGSCDHKNMTWGHEASLLYPTGDLPIRQQRSLHSESDEQEDDGHQRDGGDGGWAVVTSAMPVQMVKKRFRTKFTQEQKEKMLRFAEEVGWTVQRQEESVVQQFCREVGVKRRALKVWMHNNKHSLAKNSSLNTASVNITNNNNP